MLSELLGVSDSVPRNVRVIAIERPTLTTIYQHAHPARTRNGTVHSPQNVPTCENFRETRSSRSPDFFKDVNKFLSVLSIFVSDVGEIRFKTFMKFGLTPS